MKKKSEINIELPHFAELNELLKSQFPDYKVKYNAFADIWKMRKGPLTHTLYYNFDRKKNSMIKSEHNGGKEAKIAGVALILILIILLILEDKLNWNLDMNYILFAGVLLSVFQNQILSFFKPEYKTMLKEEHSKLLDFLENYKI